MQIKLYVPLLVAVFAIGVVSSYLFACQEGESSCKTVRMMCEKDFSEVAEKLKLVNSEKEMLETKIESIYEKLKDAKIAFNAKVDEQTKAEYEFRKVEAAVETFIEQ